MPVNKKTFLHNMITQSTQPLVLLGKFAAGSGQAIKRSEILELTGNTNTEWVPIDSDFNMDSNIAVSNEEIKNGDLAGYYEILAPRPGDVFRFALAAAAQLALGAALYYSSSQAVATSGSNVLGRSVGQENYPQQNHGSVGESDQGTTIASVSYADMTFVPSASFYSLFDDLAE